MVVAGFLFREGMGGHHRSSAQSGRALRKLPVATCQQPSRRWKEKVSDLVRGDVYIKEEP